MADEVIDLNYLTTERLSYGNEYLLPKMGATGIFIGKYGTQRYFIITRKSQFTTDYRTAGFTKLGQYALHTSTKTLYTDSWNFLRALRTSRVLTDVTNLDKCTLVVTHRWDNNDYILIRENCFSSTQTSTPAFDRKTERILRSIVAVNGSKSISGKIAKHLLTKAPVGISESDQIGNIYTIVKGDTVSVYTLNPTKIDKLMQKYDRVTPVKMRYGGYEPPSKELITSSLELTKIGRLVKRLIGKLFKDDELEQFVTAFNGQAVETSTYKLSVVTGEDITYWYSVTHYTKEAKGTLHNSCMRHASLKNSQAFYKYISNCSMVILTKGPELYARALLWTTVEGIRYLDRIYYTAATEKQQILSWAKKEGITEMHEHSPTDGTRATLAIEIDPNAFPVGVEFPFLDSVNQMSNNQRHMFVMRNGPSKRLFKEWTVSEQIYAKYKTYGCSRAGEVWNLLAVKRARSFSSTFGGFYGYIPDGKCAALDHKGNWILADISEVEPSKTHSYTYTLIKQPKDTTNVEKTKEVTA